MTQAPAFYTATMAKLFAEQGYLRKAAEIYRHLAARHPERDDVREALMAVERQLTERQAPTRKDVELLLREWKDMITQQNQKPVGGRKGP